MISCNNIMNKSTFFIASIEIINKPNQLLHIYKQTCPTYIVYLMKNLRNYKIIIM